MEQRHLTSARIIGTPGAGVYRVLINGVDSGRVFWRHSEAVEFAAGKDTMTDAETIEAARRLYANDTPGDKLARRLLAITEREQAENRQFRDLLLPLKDAVLYARAQRQPLGIGQASDRAPSSTTLRLGVQFGRERHSDGFWIECDELGPHDRDNPNPATRIAFELLRLAYAMADKVRK